MRVRQKDIADRLGLSVSLVSRALAGTAGEIGVRPDTVRRIEAAARELGYVPRAAARQLRGDGAGVLGVVAADLEDPFFGPAVAELMRQSHAAGYALSLAGLDARETVSPDLGLLLQQDLAGLVVVGGGPVPWAGDFLARGLPVVRIGAGPAPAGVRQVALDEEAAIRSLVDHLQSLGHRELGFVGADQDVHRARGRLFLRELRARGLPAGRARVAFGPASVLEAGGAGCRRLLDGWRGALPTALLCSSDAVALGVLRELADRGLRVPDDMSVTGLDDLALARLATPPLTTVRQPVADLVRSALARVATPAGPMTEPFPGGLVPRGSTARPAVRHLNPERKTA